MPWRELYPFASNFLLLDAEYSWRGGTKGTPIPAASAQLNNAGSATDKTGFRMHYVSEGEASRRSTDQTSIEPESLASPANASTNDTLLMVHGNPTWSFYYRNLIKAFASSLHCVAPDHVGMGLSDKPEDHRYSLNQHTTNLCQFVERLELRNIHLMVHDWGGAIGLGMAVKMPERIKSLIITNTAAFPPPYIPRRIQACRTPILGPWMLRTLNVFPRTAIRMATEQPGGLSSQVASGFMAPYDSYANRVGVNGFVFDIPANSKHPTWQVLQKLESELPTLRDKPTQLIWGMKDWCFRPECLERFESIFANASTRRINDAGHYVNEDAMDEVIKVVGNFLGV